MTAMRVCFSSASSLSALERRCRCTRGAELGANCSHQLCDVLAQVKRKGGNDIFVQ